MKVLGHSGGSSPKARRQIVAATLVVAIEASAPRPASSPDQIRRLTNSFSIGRTLSHAVAGTASSPPQIVSTTNAFASDCNSTLVEPKDDIEAMNNGFATVTPLNPSLTVDSKLKKFKFLTKFPFN